MNQEQEVIEFVTINEYPDYEILNDFPFTIRRKDNKLKVSSRKIEKGNSRPK